MYLLFNFSVSFSKTSNVPEKQLNTHTNAHVQRCVFLLLSQAPMWPCWFSRPGPGDTGWLEEAKCHRHHGNYQ